MLVYRRDTQASLQNQFPNPDSLAGELVYAENVNRYSHKIQHENHQSPKPPMPALPHFNPKQKS